MAMNSDFFIAYVKEAIKKSLREGGATAVFQLIEEVSEMLTAEQLGRLIDVMKKVHNKKRTVIEIKTK
jgi:hypothetical protein